MSKVQKIGQFMVTAIVASSILSGCSYVIKSGANVALGMAVQCRSNKAFRDFAFGANFD